MTSNNAVLYQARNKNCSFLFWNKHEAEEFVSQYTASSGLVVEAVPVLGSFRTFLEEALFKRKKEEEKKKMSDIFKTDESPEEVWSRSHEALRAEENKRMCLERMLRKIEGVDQRTEPVTKQGPWHDEWVLSDTGARVRWNGVCAYSRSVAGDECTDLQTIGGVKHTVKMKVEDVDRIMGKWGEKEDE